MITLDPVTAMQIVALLYLVLPINTWVALSGKRSASTALWCIGGLLGGFGVVLIGGRSTTLPHLLAFNLGSSLFLAAFLLRIHALRLELGRSGGAGWLWACVILDAALFTLLDVWGVEWVVSIYSRATQTLAVCVFVALMWRVSKQEASGHARAIALVYGVMALVLLRNLVLTVASDFPGIHQLYSSSKAQGYVTLTALVGVLTAVVGHFSFMGLQLQRTLRQQSTAAALRAQQEESQRQSQRLARLERQHTLGVLSESLSKALTQPLTTGLIHAQLAQRSLRAGAVDADFLARQLTMIVDACKRASQLIERIRSFILPASTQREAIHLQQLVNEMWELVQQAAMIQHVQVSLPQDHQCARVLGDPVQLSQVLLSILHNAIQSLSKAKVRQLKVALEPANDQILLRVQYTSAWQPPVVPNQIDALFAALWSDESGGSGVSLSIANHIIERYQGQLRTSSTPQGNTLVEIQLPLAPTVPPQEFSA